MADLFTDIKKERVRAAQSLGVIRPTRRIVGHRNKIMGAYSDILGAPNNFTRAESRLRYRMPPTAVAEIEAWFAGFKVSNGEQIITNGFTIGAVLESRGSPLRMQFDYASTYAMANGVFKNTNRLPIVVEANADLWGRFEAIVTSGQTVPSGMQLSTVGEFSVGGNQASQTFGTGPIAVPSGGTANERAFAPLCLTGIPEDPNVPTVYLLGDSMLEGLGEDNPVNSSLGVNSILGDQNGNYGGIQRGLWNSYKGGTPSQFRCTRSGDTLSLNAQEVSLKKRFPVQFCDVAIVWLGNNDIAGSSVEVIQGRYTQLFSDLMALGLVVYVVLLTPRCASSDSWTTPGGQTPDSGYESGGKRDTINTWLKSLKGTLIDDWYDPNPVVADATYPDRWKTDGSTANLFTADKTHLTSYSAALVGNDFRPWFASRMGG